MHNIVFGVQVLGENLEPNPNYEQEMYKWGFNDNSSCMGA